ncbi:MAG: tRNA (guanosine(37)-N1)-methyltransferase TrmD [Halanaerobiaceae bacterium]
MFFDILTLFPEMFAGPFEHSIVGRAREKDILDINLIDIRQYTRDKHSVTDDYPYGGGAGMVMKVEPVYRAVQDIKDNRSDSDDFPVVLLTPQGRRLNQKIVKDLSESEGMVLLCGRYEGVDERIREYIVTDEISIGDYVLTGGELPAMVLVNAVARMIPSVLGDENSKVEDSFYKGLLDYPHYTRPREYKGMEVPSVLLSGDHARIERWRSKQALKRTLIRRPDLLEKKNLGAREQELLTEIKNDLAGEN